MAGTSGLLGGVVAALIMWRLAAYGTAGLPASERSLVELALIAIAAILGLFAGTVIGHRRGAPRQVLFGATASALAGALCGAAYAIVIGAAYVHTFGGAPNGPMDALLLALAFPIFGLLGAFVGAAVGAIFGMAAGILTRR
jgi:hypothetical protein